MCVFLSNYVSIFQLRTSSFGLENLLASSLKPHRGKINIVQEMRLRSKNNRLNWQVAKQKMFSKLRATSVREAEDSMHKLMKETKIATMEELVEWFEQNEKKNFGIFDSLDSHEADLAKIKAKIQKLRKDLSLFSGHGNVVNHVKDQIAKRAQDRIVAFQRASEACKASFEHSNRLLNQMCPNVDSIFNALGERNVAENTHLTMKGVTNLSIMAFLGIIDQRVTEILQFHSPEVDSKMPTGVWEGRGETSPMRRADRVMSELNKSVNPPSVKEVANAMYTNHSETEDTFASVPLTKDQLKLKGIDFFAARVQMKERKIARAATQREQVERIASSPKIGAVNGLDQGMTGAQMRRMRKKASLPPQSS